MSAGRAHLQLAHTRLAINDLTPAGNQPVTDESDRFAMVFNGEIYNSPELRRHCEARGHRFRSHMDGEVIVHLYEDEGVAAFKRLNGIFAVAIADRLTGELVLARDPIGVKPMFYSVAGDGAITFASELRAIATAGADVGGYDLVAMAQFLTFLWVPAPRTPFARVRSLRPGETLVWSTRGIDISHYAEPLTGPVASETSADALVEQTRAQLSEAARRQLLSDVPVGLMVSGGVDSGLLWWATADHLARGFTITWPAGEREGVSAEVHSVRALRERLGTEVEEIAGPDVPTDVLPPAGDLFADPAYVLSTTIAKRAREAGIPVLLSGQGGDELFGGYRRHVVARLLHRVDIGALGRRAASVLARTGSRSLSVEYAARLARALSERDPFRGYLQLSSYSDAALRAHALGCSESEVSDDVVWQEHREFFDSLQADMSFTRKVMALDLGVYLPGLGLAYVDRAGMEHGVEIRVPWLDLELVRWAAGLPAEMLVKRGTNKWLTRRLAGNVLGEAYARAPKRGFGAPASRLPRTGDDRARGFRQGRYFALAQQLLERHRETVAPALTAAAAAARR
jgi:asparagine synthase (glutamine-hydrolysing)